MCLLLRVALLYNLFDKIILMLVITCSTPNLYALEVSRKLLSQRKAMKGRKRREGAQVLMFSPFCLPVSGPGTSETKNTSGNQDTNQQKPVDPEPGTRGNHGETGL